MVRRRTALFVLLSFALATTGCGTRGVGASPERPRPVAANSTAPRQADSVLKRLPSPSHSPNRTRGGGAAQPTPVGPLAPVGPVAPATPPTQATDPATTPDGLDAAASRGPHGPSGSITNTGTGAVALTFDDGPGPYTAQILDTLEKYGIRATFCLIGRQVAGYADQVRRMVADGDTLCNHTWDHDERLGSRSPDRIRAELERTNDAIHAVVPDATIEYFRNPGGAFSPATVSVAKSLGMSSIFWNVDPRDWSRPGTQAIVANVTGRTRPGSIVLMHDGGGNRSQTLAALPLILANLKARYALIPLPT
jgi:peptidoglycan/xylan/chitin deacetylase (PgdA/CDA1 family)